jgi:hypothetical protein
MDTKPVRPRKLKSVIAVCGSILFLMASILVAIQARHYQISGKPMPNGKGGFMAPSNGYWIAAVLVLLSVACLLQGRRFWRKKSA